MNKPAPTDHPIHDLLRRRWSPRAFSDRPLADAQVRSLFEAARWAPSSANIQPWRFIVADLSEVLAAGNRAWAPRAPLQFLAVAATEPAPGKPNPHARHDVGQALAHLTVQATSMGLAVHQMAGFDADAARERFAIPDGFEPVTAVVVGYPGDPDTLSDSLREREVAPRSRKPQSDLVFAGRFGDAL